MTNTQAQLEKILEPLVRYGTNTDSKSKAVEALINLLESKQVEAVEEFIADNFGKRCETSDKHDFPDTDYDDPKNMRCPACEMWEHYDDYTKLKSQKQGKR